MSEKHSQSGNSVILVGWNEESRLTLANGVSQFVTTNSSLPLSDILVLEPHSSEPQTASIAKRLILRSSFTEAIVSTPLQKLEVKSGGEWVSFDSVAFHKDDWLLEKKTKRVPALWQEWASQPWIMAEEIPHLPVQEIIQRQPVQELKHDGTQWILRTHDREYCASQVLWGSSLETLKTVMGRSQAKSHFISHAQFQEFDEDLSRGMYFSYQFNPEITCSLGVGRFLGIPVKHQGVRVLAVVAIGREMLRGYVAGPGEWFEDPKSMISFQKSLRRSLQWAFPEVFEAGADVTDRAPMFFAVGASPVPVLASYGSLWRQSNDGLVYLGPEQD